MKLCYALSNFSLLIFLILTIFLSSSLQARQFAGGTGTQGDPYLVATADQLNNVRQYPTAHYRQMAEIDLNVAPYNTGEGWLPIPGFSGSYDGGGYTISGLTINRPSASKVGLFEEVNAGVLTNMHLSSATVTGNLNVGVLAGTVSGNSAITGLSLDNLMVTGTYFVGGMIGNMASGSVISDSYSSGGEVQSFDGGVTGGLVGWANQATITTSYSSGIDVSAVNAPANNVGGLVGYAEHASISNSYAINTVSGTNNVGGLTGGSQGGSVSTSYSASVATGPASAGGLVGFIFSGTSISSSYFNSDSTPDNGIGAGLTTAQMLQRSSFFGFDFDTTWVVIPDGISFPKLQSSVDNEDYRTVFTMGSGTPEDPYQVSTTAQLDNIRRFPGDYYRQSTDIDLNVAPYNTGEGWLPIPGFFGSYDGGGYTIANLYINHPDRVKSGGLEAVGLFGSVSGATLTHLTLTNASVTGYNNVGALVGSATGGTTISGIRLTGGMVSGHSTVGGLAGYSEAAISEAAATGMQITGRMPGVITNTRTGGLVGEALGSITNSYSINKVTANAGVGGMVGRLSGTMTSSYSASVVTGNTPGTLVGITSTGSITHSYYNSDSTSTGWIEGTALTTAQMRQQASFTGFDFQFNWFIDEGVSYPELRVFADPSVLFAGGSGTQGDPYLVTTADHLTNIRLFPEAHYRQSADIGLSAYQDGEGWAPIRDLTGSYDGGGYTISGLMINRPATDNAGLFAKVTGATLTNLTLSNPSVTGKSFVGTLVGSISSAASRVSKIQVRGGSVTGADHLGGLAGSNEGAISESAVTEMNISGSGGSIGGLAGAITGSGSISDSYAMNTLTGSGNSAPGALVGALSGTITNSYATGSGVQEPRESYELVNSNAGTITNSYYICNSTNHRGKNWNGDCITQGNGNGTPLNMYGMRLEVSFPSFDFVNTWYMDPVFPRDPPRLRALSFAPPNFAGGSGTPEDPYLVSGVVQMAFMGLNPSAHYRQIKDINMGLPPYIGQSGWRPIPNFTGSYDGNGYTLSGLWAHWDGFDDIGLFSKVVGGSLRNITLVNPWVRGKNDVGALVGEVSSETSALSRIQITGGLVVGRENVGGMAGMSEGAISESAATGMRVNGAGYVIGGLVGHSKGTGNSISNSYAINKMSSSVSGSTPGGLAGFTSATTITNSYTASSGGGGLVSSEDGGTITNSYYNSDSTASGNNHGIALTTAQMRQGSSFTGFDFANTWLVIPDGISFPELQSFIDNEDYRTIFTIGSGTPEDPYHVSTTIQLDNIRRFPGNHYRQSADIDLNVAPYNTGEGWLPIPGFSGSYDGGSYTISGLTINRPSTNKVGLFGDVNAGALTNMHLSSATVTGNLNVGVLAGTVSGNSPITGISLDSLIVTGAHFVGGMIGNLASGSVISDSYSSAGEVQSHNSVMTGGLVGWAKQASITTSYSSGIDVSAVNAPASDVGGLVGYAENASISNSYAINTVSGADNVGGLVGGTQGGSVSTSYSASVATGPASAGGLIGLIVNGTSISNSYYNSDSTAADNGLGAGLTTVQMRQRSSFPNFDFETTWVVIPNGISFPELQFFVGEEDYRRAFTMGSGTAEDPYQVSTAAQLDNIRRFPGDHYRQTADIDLNAAPYNTGEGWLPIPGFTGSYNGGGYTISGLTINGSSASRVGLFGDIDRGALTNIRLHTPRITTTAQYAGTLAGYVLSGLISDVWVIGAEVNLSGINHYVGGLVGGLHSGSITRSRATGGKVQGHTVIGGLVGFVSGSSSISDSYSSGMNITATLYSGGLVGMIAQNASITNSYSINKVSADFSGGLVGLSASGTISTSYAAGVGTGGLASGLIGSNSGVSINNSYYNSDSTAAGHGNGTGLTTAQMSQGSSFTGFDFDTTWVVIPDGTSFPELQSFVDNTDYRRVFTMGSGTREDPYQVSNTTQLDNIRRLPGAHYRQTADIDLNVAPYNTGEGWLPIPGFSGSYDGSGRTISNLYINRASSDSVGLFGATTNATLTDITLTDAWVSAWNNTGVLLGTARGTALTDITLTDASVIGWNDVGVLLGTARGTTVISGIQISAGTVAGNFNAGGLVGALYGNSSVSASRVLGGSVRGTSSTGGLSGVMVENTSISTSQVTGSSVTGALNVGGLVGAAINNTRITRVGLTGGSVSGSTRGVGGLTGYSDGTISESFATGMSITGTEASVSEVGGLVGDAGGAITNSYVVNRVHGENATVGGFSGRLRGGLSTSYSASVVTGGSSAGLVALRVAPGLISNAFFNSDSTAASQGSEGTPLTTAQMRQGSSFTGFDFGSRWFIDEVVGFPGLQEKKENELILAGSEGWRMLASPLHTHSIGRLFNDLWLQGFPGADTTGGNPNLYLWDEANRTWTVPADTTLVPGKGTGFLMYIYSDDDHDGIPEGFPKKLKHSSGVGFSGNHTINLSFTGTGSAANDGWNLVGNPYPSSIHWNAVQGWTRSNMDATVYIWDASANNGNGAYVSWNTLGVGSKGDGKIAPWQGFWVKTHAANPRIAFSDRVKSSGGVLLKQASSQIPQLQLELEGRELSSKSVVMFHEQAEAGKDPLDAYKLQSLSSDYLLLGTLVDGQQAMDVQALPYLETQQEIELVIEGSELSGEFTLNWSPEHLPESWNAELVDTETGEHFSLAEAGSYTFSLNRAKVKAEENRKNLGVPASPITPVIKSKAGPSRFVIRMKTATSNEANPNLPTEVALQQNYPNPFNPATTINYQVPEQSRVRLEVFDMLGRKVATLLNERVEAGYHQVRFDARNLASGMYIYRLEAGDKTITKKLTLIK